jgi:hypothetical protein
MHVVYTLNESRVPQRSLMLDAFFDLKTPAKGKTLDEPLQVHPIFTDKALVSNYKKFLKENILRKLILSSNATLITLMGLGKDQQGALNDHKWIFLTI